MLFESELLKINKNTTDAEIGKLPAYEQYYLEFQFNKIYNFHMFLILWEKKKKKNSLYQPIKESNFPPI